MDGEITLTAANFRHRPHDGKRCRHERATARSIRTVQSDHQAGALDYILKPCRLSTVLPVLARSLAVRRVRMENIELHQAVGMYELSRTVGQALDFDTVLQKVADTAAAQSSVRAVSVLLSNAGSELAIAASRGEDDGRLADMQQDRIHRLWSEWLGPG